MVHSGLDLMHHGSLILHGDLMHHGSLDLMLHGSLMLHGGLMLHVGVLRYTAGSDPTCVSLFFVLLTSFFFLLFDASFEFYFSFFLMFGFAMLLIQLSTLLTIFCISQNAVVCFNRLYSRLHTQVFSHFTFSWLSFCSQPFLYFFSFTIQYLTKITLIQKM